MAREPRRIHEPRLPPGQRFRPCHPGIEREVDDRCCQHDVRDGVAQCGHDAHGQHEQRKRHDGVGDPPHHRIHPAAEEPGRQPGQPTGGKHQHHGGERDAQIHPRGHDHPAEDIPAELVGAEPMPPCRRLQGTGGVAGHRVERCDHRAQQGHQRIGQEQAQREQRDGIAGQHIARMGPDRIARRGRGGGGAHAPCRARGSIARFSRSMPRFSSTYSTAMVSTKPCTGAKSEAISASTA